MSAVLTIVKSSSANPLNDRHTKEIIKIISAHGIKPICQTIWIKTQAVAEIGITAHGGKAMMDEIRTFLNPIKADIFITRVNKRRKKILLADMDSTIVEGETLDDLAEHAGLKEKVSEITARAMNGELDFHQAIEERVGLLKGLSTKALEETLKKTKINQGAKTLVKTLRENGTHCVLVSGGFTFFTSKIANQLKFMNHHGNKLEIENEMLTGRVVPPILDKTSKVEFLRHYMNMYNLKPEDCMTIGDGANDLPMLKIAQEGYGLGMAYKAKNTVTEEIDNQIIHTDLSAALYAQGYTDDDILFS